jgi:hypothetical protein
MSLVARLIRSTTSDQGTFGRLLLPGLMLVSLELPMRDNASGRSCIPAGEYRCRWTRSPRLNRHTYEITGVPGRSGVRIHAGNFAGDRFKGYASHSLGCPLLGHRAGLIGNQRAVLASRSAVAQFEKLMAGRPFILEIKNA